MKKQRRFYFRFFQITTILILAVASFLIIKVLFSNPVSTFEVYLETEKIEFTSTQSINSEWVLDSTLIREDSAPDYYFSGSVVLPPYARISVSRQAYGYITVYIEDISPDHPVILKNKKNKDPVKSIDQTIALYQENIPERMKNGRTIIWPLIGIKGQISTGKPVGPETDATVPILRTGTVKIFKEGLFKSGIYEAGTFHLKIGDELSINEPENSAFGFLAINENPNMMVAYRVKGESATVIKPGGVKRKLQVGIFNQLLNDRFLVILSITTGGLLAIIAALTFILDYSIFHLTIKK